MQYVSGRLFSSFFFLTFFCHFLSFVSELINYGVLVCFMRVYAYECFDGSEEER